MHVRQSKQILKCGHFAAYATVQRVFGPERLEQTLNPFEPGSAAQQESRVLKRLGIFLDEVVNARRSGGDIEPRRVCRRLQLLSSNRVSNDGVSAGRSGFDHGVEHSQEFARTSDDDGLLGLSRRKQALFEGPEPRIEPAGGEYCQIEGAPDRAASTPYDAFAASG